MFNHISTQANRLVTLSKRIHNGSKTKILTITSGKGGVGKSTITTNLSYLLSQNNLNIAVLDADIGLANLQVHFNVKPQYTYFDYLSGKQELEDIFVNTQLGVTLIAGQSGYQYTQSNSMVLARVVEDIVALDKFDILLIDTGAGINSYVQEFLEITDNILAVTTTDPSALTDVYALLKMISLKKDKLMLCFNHTTKFETGQSITNSLINLAIKNKLNRKFMVKYIGNVCEDSAISTTGRLRKLFVKEFEHHLATLQMRSISQSILAEIER